MPFALGLLVSAHQLTLTIAVLLQEQGAGPTLGKPSLTCLSLRVTLTRHLDARPNSAGCQKAANLVGAKQSRHDDNRPLVLTVVIT